MAPGCEVIPTLARSTSARGGVPQAGVVAAMAGTAAGAVAVRASGAVAVLGISPDARSGVEVLQAPSTPMIAMTANTVPVFPCVSVMAVTLGATCHTAPTTDRRNAIPWPGDHVEITVLIGPGQGVRAASDGPVAVVGDVRDDVMGKVPAGRKEVDLAAPTHQERALLDDDPASIRARGVGSGWRKTGTR